MERYPQSASSLEDLPGILRFAMSCKSIQNTFLRRLLPQDGYILRNRAQYQYLHTTAYPNWSSFRLRFHATVYLEQLNHYFTCMTISFKLSAWNALQVLILRKSRAPNMTWAHVRASSAWDTLLCAGRKTIFSFGWKLNVRMCIYSCVGWGCVFQWY